MTRVKDTARYQPPIHSSRYLGRENRSIEAESDSRVVAFIKLAEDKYISNGAKFRLIDLVSKSRYFTFDAISGLVFGKTLGCIEKDHRWQGLC